MAEPIVVQVVGKGRSGSTVLGSVLGSGPEAVYVGELFRLWGRCLVQNRPCSCGEAGHTCEFWGPVLEELRADPASSWAADKPKDFLALQDRVLSWGAALGRKPTKDDLEIYLQVMTKLYAFIAAVAAAEVVVDTSKWPLDPYLLRNERARAVHLVRHPRSVVNSWLRVKVVPDSGQAMATHSPLSTATSWTARNLLAERAAAQATGRVERVRYEDFARAPASTLENIDRALGTNFAAVGISGGEVDVARSHTFGGNPSRFLAGRVEIRWDVGAEVPLGIGARAAVNAVTAPLRRRYGYGTEAHDVRD